MAYVSIGSGGAGGGWVLISLALLAIGVIRAHRQPDQAAIVSTILSRALMLLPGALVVFFSFQAGGFFPGPPARVAVLLALILAARLALGSGLGTGGRLALAVTIAFGAYGAWVLASASWSGAAERAWTSFDYVLVYGLGFVLFATSATGARDMRWVMRGLALGSFVVCVGAFLSRSVPTIWPISASLDTQRLSYPLTYWNALGLLAALGIVLCVGLTSDDRESRVLKALAAVPVPLLAATLLLTFSRGPIGACVIGLVAYLLLGRPRLLVGAAVAGAPTTAIAVIVAYRATALQQVLNGSAIQTSQGHHLALVVGLCMVAAGAVRWVLAGLDPRLLDLGRNRAPLSPRTARAGWAAGIVAVVLAALVFDLPGAVHTEYDRFVQGNVLGGQAQVRDRLTKVGADGRIGLWKIALHEFDGAPVAGTGAGTYAVVYAQKRGSQSQVLNAHSLYFENLGELGVVGLALLICVIAGALVAIGRRIRKPERTLYAAALAVTLAWAVHAGFDWDWQMPAITLPAFVLAGAAVSCVTTLAGRRRESRPVFALVALVAALVPALISVSQHHLSAALTAFARSDCADAASEARSALTPLSFRPSPHEILAYCDTARGVRVTATAEMTQAARDDPKSWEPRYGLAVVTAAAGGDPRRVAHAAKSLDPLEPVLNTLAGKFDEDPSRAWANDAEAAPLPVGGQYGTSIAALRATIRR